MSAGPGWDNADKWEREHKSCTKAYNDLEQVVDAKDQEIKKLRELLDERNQVIGNLRKMSFKLKFNAEKLWQLAADKEAH